VQETRPRTGRGRSTGTVEAGHHEQSLDDWLGDVSDDDWDEHPAPRADAWAAAPTYESRPADDPDDRPAAPAGARNAVDTRRATVERRRIVAGGVLVAILGIVAAALVVLLRGGDTAPVTPTVPAATITAPNESEAPTVPATTTPSTPSTTPETTSPAEGAATFTLPEGTKLRRGEEADAALVTELQRALSSAGYDPGPADGTYGEQTEAAVTAFQQDNQLTADGVVGPDTAAALNTALAGD